MARKAAISGATSRVRKNMDMNQHKLNAAMRILGTSSETETVDEALDNVAFIESQIIAMRELAEAGGIDDVFGNMEPVLPRKVAERKPRRK